MTIKWVSALPPVIRRPFQSNRPLTHSNSNVGYACFFMISSGGTGKTKISVHHIFKGRIQKKNLTIKLAFRPPPIHQRPFRRDRPLPQSKSNVGYTRLFMISSGGRGKTKFPSIIFLGGWGGGGGDVRWRWQRGSVRRRQFGNGIRRGDGEREM
jgi:hypothetical protein